MIIKIEANSNGSHANQSTTPEVIPNGWAMVPDSIVIPDTFPFVNITVQNEIVTSMTAGIVPDPEPAPPTKPTAEERLEALEAAMLEMMEVK